MTELIKLNGNIVVCGTGALVKAPCGYFSFPEANIWNWEVIYEENGSWDGIDSSSPAFNWTACGGGSTPDDANQVPDCCGGSSRGESFYGELETTIIFFCEQTLSFSVQGDVELMNAGFDMGVIQITGSEGEFYQNILIESTEGGINCSMTRKNGSASLLIKCCAKVKIIAQSNDFLHHTPGDHSWEFSY